MRNIGNDTIRPLSSAQFGIWVAQRLDLGSPAYNIAEYFDILGPVDPERFEKALRRVVAEADALHIRVVESDKGPQQYSDPDIDWVMPFIDVSTEPAPRVAAEAWMYEDMGRVADLTCDPLFGYALFRAAPDRFFWYQRYHHLCNDGYGGALIAQRLAELYSAVAENRASESTKQLSWFNLLDNEEDYRLSVHYARDRDYWRKQLTARPGSVTLSGKPPARSPVFIRSTDHLAVQDADALRALCMVYQVSLPEMVTAAAAIYLHRLTGEPDLTLGMPLTARFGARMRSIVGMCTNVLPLRLAIDVNGSFGELLQQVSRGMRQMLRHQRYRAEDLRHDLGLRPDEPETYGMIVNVMAFDYDLRFDGNAAHVHNISNGPVEDLSIVAYDRQNGSDVRIDFDANPAHYTREVLASHQQRFLALLAQFAKATPDQPLHRFEMLDVHERHTILEVFNATQMDFPRDGTIHEMFAAQAACTPDAVALTFRDRSWTYRDLDERAEAIARRLSKAGVQAEMIVGICVQRSLELVAGMLGILKAGAAYLPLDHTYPPERLALMIEDAQPLLVLASGCTRDCLAMAKTSIQLVEEDQSPVANHINESGMQRVGGSNLAYVIYTSGSAGKPKAVMVEHRNAMNFFAGMDAVLGVKPGVWLAVASVSFDASVMEIWWSLTRGYQVVLWPGVEDGMDSPILELIREHRVTHVLLVPSFLWTLLTLPGASASLALLRTLVVGAEAVSPELIKQLGTVPSRRIVNMYGPTEATVVATTWEIEPEAASISIGRPIANTQIYILDHHGLPVPVGVTGEMYVGGASVTRGYLARPELTAERFVPDRFKEPEGHLYRTGDLARFRSDGTIDFVGRLDHQVKIRGFRIETGEIEEVLGRHPGVRAAVIDVQEEVGRGKRLVAYVVPGTAEALTTKELREWVGRELPAYMVPAAFVTLDALPSTPNGKLDRKSLPSPERSMVAEKMFIAPRNSTEEVMAQIWAEVLNLQQVGIDDNFFDLGGNSLLAVRMIVAIEQRFGVALPLQVLFRTPTVALLTENLNKATDEIRNNAPEASSSATERDGRPRTMTERRLLAIWERLIETRPIGIYDSFADIQGHSTLFEKMLAEIRSEFGVFAEGLPIDAVIESPSIEALARIIDDAIEPPPSSLVVCMQPHGNERPLFLIHAGGGYVFFYRALALRLGRERPVYAIRAETKSDGFGRPFEQCESIEELAARYIAEIKTVQPKGPYFLGGGCVGGVVAFEMAKQLRAQGEDIAAPVMIFDSFMLNNPHARTYQKAISGHIPLRNRIAAQLIHASRLGVNKAVGYLASKLIRAMHRRWGQVRTKILNFAGELKWKVSLALGRSMPIELEQSRITASFMKVSERLLSKYTPGEYEGSIALFKATEGLDPEPLWTSLALRSMTVHKMPGIHLDMMEEPTVITTASLVAKYLDDATHRSWAANEVEALPQIFHKPACRSEMTGRLA